MATPILDTELCLHGIVVVGHNTWTLSTGWAAETRIVHVTEDAL